nr:hypothetical protein [Piscibacillus salipiscarius]
MKWIGAILILFTCTWVGIDIARNYSKRPKQIRELLHALQIMEAEMVYGQEPIHQVLYKISKQLTPPLGYIFMIYLKLSLIAMSHYTPFGSKH